MGLVSSLVKSNSLHIQGDYFVVELAQLKAGVTCTFDLYLGLKAGGAPVLYRTADLDFTEFEKSRLLERGIDRVLVPLKQRNTYQRYLEKHMGSLLKDPAISTEEKSGIMYESAQGLVQDLLGNPHAHDLKERAGSMVEHTVNFMYNNSDSFQHLMAVSSYDYYTYTHSVNVFVYASALAQRLGHTQSELRVFGEGALLHDLGKSRVDLNIINSSGKLTEEEWVQMKAHPSIGCELLLAQDVRNPVILDVTRHHHEKLNGRGYPDGLANDEISRWARICTIADIFDALTTKRSYKDAMDSFAALQFMRDRMRDELDPDIFRVFVELMGRH
ncbi:MAG: HD domain-containing protein [Candidatus Hydrogenedentes bacterium]|nr:HD domain-containing protein [Candidatus Hydrogenedentota bacterium]